MGRGKAETGVVAEAEAAGRELEQHHHERAPPKRRASRLPSAIQFPLVAVLSLSLSALGYSFVNQWSKGELATIARTLENTKTEVAVLAGWSICELALGWYGSFDSFDLAALSLLSHGPTLYLLTSFYHIRPWTAAACLTVDVLSSFVPFYLLRPLSGPHSAAATLPNRDLVTDRTVQAYTTLLAGAVYCVTLSTAYNTFLPKALVLYFRGLPSIEPAHSATTFLFVSTPAVLLSLLFGLAARSFIFTPFATTGRSPDDARVAAFDPVRATLQETVWWNLWGYTAQAKVAIERTAVVVLVTGIRTYLECSLTVAGVEGTGAFAYASVWSTAALVTGLALRFVGRD